MKTLKAVSALLTYPMAGLQGAVPEIRHVLQEEGVLTQARREALEPLLASLAVEDLYDLQERYVMLFDRTRSLSLHLFEHVHGESRDRGQAMVDLRNVYEDGGFELTGPVVYRMSAALRAAVLCDVPVLSAAFVPAKGPSAGLAEPLSSRSFVVGFGSAVRHASRPCKRHGGEAASPEGCRLFILNYDHADFSIR